MNYICNSSDYMNKSFMHLINLSIYPNYECIINSIKAGYNTDYKLIVNSTPNDEIHRGQIDISDILIEYGRYEDVHQQDYTPLLKQKGFKVSNELHHFLVKQ